MKSLSLEQMLRRRQNVKIVRRSLDEKQGYKSSTKRLVFYASILSQRNGSRLAKNEYKAPINTAAKVSKRCGKKHALRQQ